MRATQTTPPVLEHQEAPEQTVVGAAGHVRLEGAAELRAIEPVLRERLQRVPGGLLERATDPGLQRGVKPRFLPSRTSPWSRGRSLAQGVLATAPLTLSAAGM